MRPCRILMTADAVGGVWPYACDLSAALRPLGVETVLALLGPAASAAQRKDLDGAVTFIETGLALDWLAPDAASVAASGSAIASLASDLGVDVIHLNQPALAASARIGVPVVTVIHSCVATWWQAVHGGEAPPSFAWQTELVSRGLRCSDVVAAPSEAFAAAVQRTYEMPHQPHVVPNGRWPVASDDSIPVDSVFTAGRLWDAGKNVAALDRLAARLAHPFQAAGALRGPHDGGVALHHIEALGALDAATLAAYLARRPIFVSAALYEPFGLAVLEAASAGCALVLSDIATFRETWEGAAIFVASGDVDGFAEAIDRLLRDGEMRARQGDLARSRAAAFTPTRMAAAMHALYAQSLTTREPKLRTAAA